MPLPRLATRRCRITLSTEPAVRCGAPLWQSPELAKYFSTMMWLGQVIDFHLRPDQQPEGSAQSVDPLDVPEHVAPPNRTDAGAECSDGCCQAAASFRQTAAPVLTRLLLRRSGAEANWYAMQGALSALFGHAMSLSIADLDRIASEASHTDGAPPTGGSSAAVRSGSVKLGHEVDPRWAEADIDWDMVRQVTKRTHALQRALAADSALAYPAYVLQAAQAQVSTPAASLRCCTAHSLPHMAQVRRQCAVPCEHQGAHVAVAGAKVCVGWVCG